MLSNFVNRSLNTGIIHQTRALHSGGVLTKKATKKAGKGKKADDDEEVEIVDLKSYIQQATTAFQKSVELHQKKLNELKAGTSNPTIFDKLKVGKENLKFTDLATTSTKGRNGLIITVFDPKDTKSVISSILGAGLNLNPERIPNNEQQLKVSLPPPTTETRKQNCKLLKDVFEEYKNSANKNSLGHIRGEILKALKTIDKKNDSVKKVTQDLEKLHKEYTQKLQDSLKQAEKSVLG
ncbi:LAME_0H10000g1_1 [Lachancea meyersii CBS 8951]|uniref:Ribosome-recycling factor, mitochondrial n=1 Tax=Lachancea meyersii CBS 8951 TaxID=1266667 RepID=A0A1G4KFV2_9SACH|nr:LAME_0H10000g1_1 [Lachancea meyersii CBS 8951]